MSRLAILGGDPVIQKAFRHYEAMGAPERQAVLDVVQSGTLSGFYGSWGEEFFGGPRVKEFEKAWARVFGVKHAVSVNSATSGLYAAVGAIGVGPGDEVIVPPYTMSATAMAPLVYGALPVFADIEPETFCLDLDAVRRAITSKTKAILVVNLFGHPGRLSELRAMADAHGLYLIEDNAQGPLAEEHGRYAGTIGHIGVFSLNYHKHIHTGEGGMCVTEDDRLALRLQLIRNHGENAVEDLGIEDLTNLVGFNYRMTELSAAVGLVQLQNADRHVGKRQKTAEALSAGIAGLEGLTPPVVREGCRHVYYVWAFKVDETALGLSRRAFVRALTEEGLPLCEGYVRPLYLLPLFQRKTALGNHGYPFTLGTPQYDKGTCPTAERLHERELVFFENCMYHVEEGLHDRILECFHKVHRMRGELGKIEC